LTFLRVYLVLPRENSEDGFAFARRCVLACFSRGEAALNLDFAYASVLDTQTPQERDMADVAAASWVVVATKAVCYTDRGITPEMIETLAGVKQLELPIDFRRLAGGRPGAEALHFQGIPHNESDCALCLGPKRVEELRQEGLTVDELEQMSHLPKRKEE
jgi:hypothetical protein